LSGVKTSARAVLEGFGRISNGISKAQRRETPLHCAHVAYETTDHVVGLVNTREETDLRQQLTTIDAQKTIAEAYEAHMMDASLLLHRSRIGWWRLTR
jgi:hypothetical protein